MAGYYVYTPADAGTNRKALEAAGFFDGETPLLKLGDDLTPHPIKAGPDKGPGTLWTFQNEPESIPPLKYVPSKQIWHKAPPDPIADLPAGRYWFGIYKPKPPEPKELERFETFTSINQTLGDGQTWMIPNMAELPMRFAFDEETGEATKTVLDRFENIYDAMIWATGTAAAHARDDRPIPEMEGFALACRLLNLNYRLTPAMIGFLQLVEPKHLFGILTACGDYGMINGLIDEQQKKN